MLISLMVYVDVKHHVYLLTYEGRRERERRDRKRYLTTVSAIYSNFHNEGRRELELELENFILQGL